MADYTEDKKASGLDVLTSLADDDILVSGDASDAGKLKGITKANLKTDLGIPTLQSEVDLNTVKRHDAVTVTDSAEIDFTLTGQDITASLIAGSINETKLDTSVNTSLDLADSSTQPADIADFETTTELNARDTANRARANHTGTQTASTISDFDTEVANNTAVVANTAKISYTDASKVAGIEDNATADQTGAEIKTAYESNANTNAFTDSEKTNLGNQSGTNTGDQVGDGTTITGAGTVADPFVSVGGGGGASKIDDLTDGISDGSSVSLGSGAGTNDDGTANRNTAVGAYALHTNTTGYDNSAQGYASLYSSTTGSYNSAQGLNSLHSNTTGYYNSAQGANALYSNTSGHSNSAQGLNSLYFNTTGSNNSAQGVSVLYSSTTGSYNSAQGVNAGRYIADGTTGNTTGDYNVFLGYNTKALADNDQNEIVIGYNAIGIGSNSVTLGSDSIATTALKGNVGIGTTSPDTRLDVNGAITQRPLSSDPADPDAGNSVQWVSDGTGSGDAGDVMMKINVGGTTKIITLVDFSSAT